tara:strand:+ start:457 stop:873 length:417 start_codon:yes stop_codon:yes gene_type:complete
MNIFKIAFVGFMATANAFDLEDYATTYRATRDAYLKALNEFKLATGPYHAARDAYVSASQAYIQTTYDDDTSGAEQLVEDEEAAEAAQAGGARRLRVLTTGAKLEEFSRLMKQFTNEESQIAKDEQVLKIRSIVKSLD